MTKLAADVSNALPRIGSTMTYGGDGDPAGGSWLLADGRLVDRTTYAAYFAIVGHKFNGGVDPGNNKVRIQDKRGRTSIGPDSMGTAQGTANRIPNSNRVAGQSGGEERHLTTSAEAGSPGHTHSATATATVTSGAVWNGAPTDGYGAVGNSSERPFGLIVPTLAAAVTVGASASVNAIVAHNNMQPYEVENVIVRVL
jgi:microcystin-dependent protein